jgi:DNA ligase (NAD+)
MLLIKSNGGKVVTSVSKNLTYLISGESSGSKLESAKNLGVTIITEDELVKLLEIEKSIQDTSINTQKSLMDF